MIGISIVNSLGVNITGLNPATRSFVSTAGITNPVQVSAINNLINGLQADGIWPKMKAIYPFVTDNRNFAEYTENFNSWLFFQYSSISTNSTTAPNGTLTADTLISGATLGRQETYRTPAQTYTNGVKYTMSVYAKSNGKTWLYLGTNVNEAVFFNLQNGTVGSETSLWSGTIESVGNNWYRCTATFTYGSLASAQQIVIGNASANGVYSDTGNGVLGNYVWGAQVELGSTATTYQPIATTQQAYIASQFKYNLKDPRDLDAAFRLVFNGGWTHSSTGATPNGTNGFADTKLNDNTILNLSNVHASIYSRTNVNGAFVDLGVSGGTNSGINLFTRLANLTYFRIHDEDAQTISTLDSRGLFLGYRNSASTKNYSVNGVKTTLTSTVGSKANGNIYLGALLTVPAAIVTNYSSRQIAFSSIGDGLTDTEAQNFYTRVQAFQTALSRQV